MKRKNKSFYIVLIILILFSVSIGYAVINRTLSITGNSEVKQNTWDIHFENVQVTIGSVEAPEPTIDNTALLVNFNFMLNLPGDFYEFTVEVHNDGSIDSMIDSITKTPSLTEEQKKYMTYIVEYQNGEQITSKQIIRAFEFVRLKVRVEFRSDVSESDLPTSNLTFDLGFDLNYVQADNTGVNVLDNGIFFARANGLLEDIGTIVTIGTEKFYTIGIEGDNVKLLSMYNLYVGNDCKSNSSSSCTSYGAEATGMQDENMIGLDSGYTKRKGTIAFSSETQKGINYSDYEGSIVEGYVDNYKIEIEKMGIEVVDARLITKEELTHEKIGCNDSDLTCSGVPSFIYATSYWSGSLYDTNSIWVVHNSERFDYHEFNYDYGAGVRPVILIPISDVIIEGKPVANGNIEDIGTIVTIGTEQFYTIGTEGDNVKLLSMYNLYVGNECIIDEPNSSCNEYTDVTGMQDNNMRGWVLEHNISKGSIPFASTSQKGEDYSDYNGSIVEVYVNNYKNLLESKFGIQIEEVRLITKDELISEDIGCNYSLKTCTDAPAFIYSTSYWTGFSESSTYIWYVNNNGYFDNSYYDNYKYLGIRPVIVISKLYFE